MNYLQRIVHAALHPFYPPYCYACKHPLVSVQSVCDLCAHEIELISPMNRCAFCFTEHISCTRCRYCLQHPPHHRLFGSAACLFESSVVNDLIQQMIHRPMWHLETAFASLAFIQLHTLCWPSFDLVLLEPSHWLSLSRPEQKLSQRIGKYLAKLLHAPSLATHLNPASLSSPERPLETQYWSETIEVQFSFPKPLHGLTLLTFSLHTQKGTTKKSFIKAIEPKGLARVYHLSLVADLGSWIDE